MVIDGMWVVSALALFVPKSHPLLAGFIPKEIHSYINIYKYILVRYIFVLLLIKTGTFAHNLLPPVKVYEGI